MVFKDKPAIGVAIGTAVTDLFILVYLLAVTWKWISKAVFNFNSLKILIATVLVLMMTFIIRDPMHNLLVGNGISVATSYIIELVSIVLIDAVIYIGVLILLKEDLVCSFSRKRRANNNA